MKNLLKNEKFSRSLYPKQHLNSKVGGSRLIPIFLIAKEYHVGGACVKPLFVDRTWVINKNHPGLRRMITGISVADESCLFSRWPRRGEARRDEARRGEARVPGGSGWLAPNVATASGVEEKRVVSKGTKNQVSLCWCWWHKEVMDVWRATLAS